MLGRLNFDSLAGVRIHLFVALPQTVLTFVCPLPIILPLRCIWGGALKAGVEWFSTEPSVSCKSRRDAGLR